MKYVVILLTLMGNLLLGSLNAAAAADDTPIPLPKDSSISEAFIHYVAYGPREKAMQLLADDGKDASNDWINFDEKGNLSDGDGHKTALMIAAEDGALVMVQAILNHNPSTTKRPRHESNFINFAAHSTIKGLKKYKNVLHYTAGSECLTDNKNLDDQDRATIVQEIIAHADKKTAAKIINERTTNDDDNATPLILALAKKRVKTAQALLDAGADTTIQAERTAQLARKLALAAQAAEDAATDDTPEKPRAQKYRKACDKIVTAITRPDTKDADTAADTSAAVAAPAQPSEGIIGGLWRRIKRATGSNECHTKLEDVDASEGSSGGGGATVSKAAAAPAPVKADTSSGGGSGGSGSDDDVSVPISAGTPEAVSASPESAIRVAKPAAAPASAVVPVGTVVKKQKVRKKAPVLGTAVTGAGVNVVA